MRLPWRGAKVRSGRGGHGQVSTPDHGPEEWAIVKELGQEATARACPRELELFHDVMAGFQRDPLGAAGQRLRPPVGLGVDLALESTEVLWLTSLLVSAVAGKVTENVIGGLSRTTRERLMPLLRRHGRTHGPAENRTGGSQQEETAVVPAPRSPQPAALQRGLTDEELSEVRALLEAGAAAGGIAEDKAARYVNAILGALDGDARETGTDT